MAKESGLGDNLYLGGYDISGDVGALGRIAGGLAGTQDVTGINSHAYERRGLHRDGGIDWTGFFNPASVAGGDSEDGAHTVLANRPTTDRTITYCRGTALGSPAACMIGKQLTYDPTRGADGSLTIALQSQANGFGLEWGVLLTPGKRTDTSATDGPSVDLGSGPTLHGMQAWLHVFDLDGDDVTVTVEGSADDGATDPWTPVTGASFTVTAAPTALRVETARNAQVPRYLRAVTTTTDGFSSVTFALVATRNDVEVTF